MNFSYETWKQQAVKKKKENKTFLGHSRRISGLEKKLPKLHDEAFSKIDCLKCANCCKTISPRFKTPDIARVAKFKGMKESELIDKYLRLDEDGDYVVKNTPCPFLGADNMCSIYEARPGDCARYPYTDRREFFQYTDTTYLNSTICPAVFYVLERLKQMV